MTDRWSLTSAAGSVVDLRRALGLGRDKLQEDPVLGWVDEQAAQALRRLQARAEDAGHRVRVASGYRDYHRQLKIFNEKACGLRVVHDDMGEPLHKSEFSEEQWLHAILRFSALPGTSRHHWGTDFDVWDAAAVDATYSPALEPAEYCGSGPFSGFRAWLDDLIDRDDAEGFFRPYRQDFGGTAPEPWHISYRPAAERFSPLVTAEILRPLWRGEAGNWRGERRHERTSPGAAPLALLDVIEPQLTSLLKRYVVD